MGKIKKILENELVGGTQTTDVYPVTSTKAVYDTSNKVLDDYIQHLKKTSTFAGIATPTTNPGTPDGPVFYIANGKGTYTNFGGIDVTEDEVIILYWNTAWHKISTGIASQEKLSELEGEIGEALGKAFISNIFTIKNCKRDKNTGEIVKYTGYGSYNTTMLFDIDSFTNARTEGIKIKIGQFRGIDEGVAFFYDANKNFIGFDASTVTLSTVTPFPASSIPDNAKFIAFNQYDSNLDVILVGETLNDLKQQIKVNESNISKINTEITEIKNDIEDANKSIENIDKSLEKLDGISVFGGYPKNLFDKDNLKFDGYRIIGPADTTVPLWDAGNKDGQVSTYQASGFCVNDIEIKKLNSEISIIGIERYCIFDADHIGIGYIKQPDSLTKTTVTLPTNAKYFRAQARKSNLDNVKVVYGNTFDGTQKDIDVDGVHVFGTIDDIKVGIDIRKEENVTAYFNPAMSISELFAKVNDVNAVLALQNKVSVESFFIPTFAPKNIETFCEMMNKNLRGNIINADMSMGVICRKLNQAISKRILRFDDAKLPIGNMRDASLMINHPHLGEPSAIVSEDGSTLYIYAYKKRVSTTDGVNWTEAIDTPFNDGRYLMHNNVTIIDGVYYLIGVSSNSGGNLVMYTSNDGVNFEYKGILLKSGVELKSGCPVTDWGNTSLIKEYGSGKFYLYVESQDDDPTNRFWRLNLVEYEDFVTENADGTIGKRVFYEGNPVLEKPYGYYQPSAASISAGNPDFAKGMDNRPIKSDGKYYMYFHSTCDSISHIMRASSIDLRTWTVDGLMLDNRDVPTNGDDTSGNADHCIIEFKGRTYLFYTWNINSDKSGTRPYQKEFIKYTIDDRPLSELLKLRP